MPKPMVLIKNNDDQVYEEHFREEDIRIPAGGTIKMPRRKAVRFLATFPPDTKEGELRVKKLSMLPLNGVIQGGQNMFHDDAPKEYVCHLDGTTHKTQQELDEYLKKYSHLTVKPKKEVKPRLCPFCKKSFDDVDLLLAHIDIHMEERHGTKPAPRGEPDMEVKKEVKKGKK